MFFDNISIETYHKYRRIFCSKKGNIRSAPFGNNIVRLIYPKRPGLVTRQVSKRYIPYFGMSSKRKALSAGFPDH